MPASDAIADMDGDELPFGQCKLRCLKTPGHTPESTGVLVTDLGGGTAPFAVFTGDTLFIGYAGGR